MITQDDPVASLDSYRTAAAVLAQYDPGTLNPVGGQISDSQAVQALMAESVRLIDSAGDIHWMLRHAIRRDVLRRLGTRAAMQAALAANPERLRISLQDVLEAAIYGRLPPLAQLNAGQLAALLQVVAWLGDILDDLPESSVVREYFDRAQFLEPLRRLAGGHFRGRGMELQTLRNYSCAEGPARFTNRSPLLIYGRGGTGKSSLLAEFVLNRVAPAGRRSLPLFVFVGLDRFSVLAEEPAMLLAEAVRQIGIQHPPATRAAAEFRDRWRLHSRARSFSAAGARDAERAVISDFSAFMRSWQGSDDPLLFVLDQFEEVQYHGSDITLYFLDFVRDLISAIPYLCIVIASRAPIDLPESVVLHLEELDNQAAIAVLEALGVADKHLAQEIVERVGGDPLSLRLSADLLRRGEGISVLANLPAAAQGAQALLYRRLIDHIHDPEIRGLASMAAVLRKLTPALIVDVLAAPCGMTIDTEEQAQSLFESLRREVVLMIDDGTVLRFRVDVRRSILRLLHETYPAAVAQIHQNAIAYYQRYGDIRSRAEEIYHRLSLGTDLKLVEQRWIDGVGSYLYGSLDELAEPGRSFLAARGGFHFV